MGASEVIPPKSVGTVTRLQVCPSKRTSRGGIGRPGGPPTNPAVPPAHTCVGETASTLPTADRGKPSTIVCVHICPSQCATAAPELVSPAAQTSSAARMCRPYTDPGGTGTSRQPFPSRRSRA